MRREELVDLNAFLAVAKEQNFTWAAAKLGTSQPALSHTIRRLESHLGVRLLTRTTRRVAPTEAGERLLKTLEPALEDIAAELGALSVLRDKPSGTIRITTSEHAAHSVLWPALEKLLPDYPDVKVELAIDSGLTDIVAERFDAGVRLGEQVAKDMVAVRIGPDLRIAVVGAPAYFATHPKPRTPQDLAHHHCINLRLPTAGGLYAWELQKGGRELRVRVEGQLAFNNVPMILEPRRRVSASPAYWTTMSAHSSPTAVSSAYWTAGALRSQAIIFTIRAAASRRQPLRCSSIRCAGERERSWSR